jgi:hypothetical protein
VIFLYEIVTLINVFMDVFINSLFFHEKREKRGTLKAKRKRRKKRRSTMPVVDIVVYLRKFN